MQRKWKLKALNGQGSGMLRRAATVGTTLMVLVGGGVVIAESAIAHSGVPKPSCEGLKVAFSNYNDQKDSSGQYKNTIKVTVDGSTLENTKFGSSFTKTYAWTKFEDHHYIVEVKAWDDPNGSNGWTKTFEGDSEACETRIPVPAAPATMDYCGAGNAAYVEESDTDVLDWTFGSNYTTATVATIGDNVFFEDGTNFHDYGTVEEYNTEPCTTLSPAGSIRTSCSGAVKFRLDNSASNVLVTFKSVVGGKVMRHQVRAGQVKTVIRQGKPGQKAVLWASKVKLDEAKVPRPCPVIRPKAHINTSCTGRAVATLNNKASNRRVSFFVVAGENKPNEGAQAWQLFVKANRVREFRFDGRKFSPGTVLKVLHGDKLLDRAKVPPRCFVPTVPPDTGQRPVSARVSGAS